jgi:TPR repeat protein
MYINGQGAPPDEERAQLYFSAALDFNYKCAKNEIID